MDRPVLHPLALELAAHERLQEFAAALPVRARVSEPALPLLLAALHEHLGRTLVCVLPEDADARDAAEAAGGFLGPGAGGLVCVSAAALAEGMPPPAARAEAVLLEVGAEPGIDGLAASFAASGYEGVEPVEERAQVG